MIKKIKAMLRRKPKVTQTLSAKIIVGPETAERLGVPVGSEIDLGVISETVSKGWGVKASG